MVVGGVEGNFSVTLWSKPGLEALDLDLDQAEQKISWSLLRTKVCVLVFGFSSCTVLVSFLVAEPDMMEVVV